MVKLAQLCIRLATLLVQSKDKERKINLKTITKLADITGRRWWIPLDITTLLHQKYKSMKEYRLCKRICITLKATYLEERAREIAKIGNTKEEARINSLLSTEKSREKARRLKFIYPISKEAVVNRLRIQIPDAEGK